MKNKGILSFIFIVAISVLATVGVYSVMNRSGQEQPQYTSIADVVDETGVYVPKQVRDICEAHPDGYEYSNTFGAVSIMSKTADPQEGEFIYRIMDYEAVHVDPLGIYEEPEQRHKYILKELNVKDVQSDTVFYIAYRVMSIADKKSTVLNWCTFEKSYGIQVYGEYSMDEMLSLAFDGSDMEISEKFVEASNEEIDRALGFDEENVQSTESMSESVSEGVSESDLATEDKVVKPERLTGEVYEVPTLSGVITFPKFESKMIILPYNGYAGITLNGKEVAYAVYNEKGKEAIEIKSGLTIAEAEKGFSIAYSASNPFTEDSVEYKDYELLVSSMDKILGSYHDLV